MSCLAVFTYHYLTDPSEPLQRNILGPSRKAFEEQVGFLSREYSPLRPEDLPAFFESEDEGDDVYFMLTFDDGLKEHIKFAAPLLAARGLSGIFFVPSCILEGLPIPPTVLHYSLALLRLAETVRLVNDALERAGLKTRFLIDQNKKASENISRLKQFFKTGLDRDSSFEVACLLFQAGLKKQIPDIMERVYMGRGDLAALRKAGQTLGAHTRTHPSLGDGPAQSLTEAEILDSARALGRAAEVEIRHFAFPFGLAEDSPDGLRQVFNKAGISFAFTTNAALNRPRTDPFRISRRSVYGSDDVDSLACFIREKLRGGRP